MEHRGRVATERARIRGGAQSEHRAKEARGHGVARIGVVAQQGGGELGGHAELCERTLGRREEGHEAEAPVRPGVGIVGAHEVAERMVPRVEQKGAGADHARRRAHGRGAQGKHGRRRRHRRPGDAQRRREHVARTVSLQGAHHWGTARPVRVYPPDVVR